MVGTCYGDGDYICRLDRWIPDKDSNQLDQIRDKMVELGFCFETKHHYCELAEGLGEQEYYQITTHHSGMKPLTFWNHKKSINQTRLETYVTAHKKWKETK